MRTKTIYFFSLFLTITMMTGCFHISSGPKPSKSKMTKKYSVTPFNKIENKAPANIVFTQGNVTKVEAVDRSRMISTPPTHCPWSKTLYAEYRM